MLSVLVASVLTLCTVGEEDSHAGHDHGGMNVNFEWAGIFETSGSMYMWTAQKVDGNYADPTMKLAALPASAASDKELHGLEVEGMHAMGQSCVPLPAGGVIVPEMDKCYLLQFDESMWQSLFKVNASATTAIAFFAQHFPTEFEATAHYLKDPTGEDIEPVAELPEEAPAPAPATADDADKPWGDVIGASVVIQFVTLIGVIFAVPACQRIAASYQNELHGIVSGFAAGALLACTFFLLLFEATHLVATGWTKEVDTLWRWGTMILLGFSLPAFVDLACGIAMASVGQPVTSVAGPGADVEQDQTKVAAVSMSQRVRLLAGVLIGDFFHNLCDGFFVGAAFQGCGADFGWGVAVATILHELPQEIADYAILTGPQVGLGPIKALTANFLSGLSVILGAVIVLSSDIDNSNIGLLLSFGGGVYLHIAATECMPRIYNEKLSLRIRCACLLAFVVGAVLIGLVLLDHEHCVPPTPEGAAPAADPHAGHNH